MGNKSAIFLFSPSVIWTLTFLIFCLELLVDCQIAYVWNNILCYGGHWLIYIKNVINNSGSLGWEPQRTTTHFSQDLEELYV